MVEKPFSSSFFGTSLASLLNAMKVDTLIICGYSISGCVRATTTDSMQYGFFSIVVGDACGDRHAYPRDANLLDIQMKFGEVVSTKAMISTCNEDSTWTDEQLEPRMSSYLDRDSGV